MRWALLAAVLVGIGAGVLRGDEGLLVASFVAVALGYGIYLNVSSLVVSSRNVSLENDRLLITGGNGRLLASVALREPFQAKCVHYDGKSALYEVTQNQKTTRFAVASSDSGDVVKAMQLPWPPSTTPYGSWMR